ncbi:MAG: hypothetical protein ABDH21_03440 [bacterium]
MIVLFPPSITKFLNLCEIVIYYPDRISYISDQEFSVKKNNLQSFLTDLKSQVIDEFKLLRATVNIEPDFVTKIQQTIYNLESQLKNVLEKLENTDLKAVNSDFVEELLQGIITILDVNNQVAGILKEQSLISPYPIVDRFLKIFWSYVENITNLESFPVDLLIRYLFGVYNLIQQTEKKLNLEKVLFETQEEVKTIIQEQIDFVEAIKYALGASFELINGSINLSEEPDLANKIFIQINQASNGLFVAEKEKLKKIKFDELLRNFSKYDDDTKMLLANILNDLLLSSFLNSEFVNSIQNMEDNRLTALKFIIANRNLEGDYLQIFENLDEQELQSITAVLSSLNTNQQDINNSQIKEFINSFVLYASFHLPLSVFINILQNVKNIIKIGAIINTNFKEKLIELPSVLDNLAEECISYCIYEDNIESMYLCFVESLLMYRSFSIEVLSLLTSKIYCPRCREGNEFLSEKCRKCNLVFPLSIEKLFLISLQKIPPIIQNYVLSIIENYLINNDQEKALSQVNQSINELDKLYTSISKISELEQYSRNTVVLKNCLIDIREMIENMDNQTAVLEKLIEFMKNVELLSGLFFGKIRF